MPLFFFHYAFGPDERIPPVAELQAIEASDLADAAERVKKRLVIGPPGTTETWVRIVTKSTADGEVLEAIQQRIELPRTAADN